MNIRKQTPINPDNWLYQDQAEDKRVFAKFVFLGVDAKEWEECTDAEKVQWEIDHPEPELVEEEEQ